MRIKEGRRTAPSARAWKFGVSAHPGELRGPEGGAAALHGIGGEFHATNGTAALRATPLTDEQVAIAEAGFKRLERDEDLLTAIDHWLRTGKPTVVKESPRLD